MPLMTVHLVRGRSPEQVRDVLDAVHDAMVEAFGVPERDRYQVVHQHEPGSMIIEDTGLGIPRTDSVVLVQVVSRRRDREKKEALYRLLTEHLERRCGVAPTDVMTSIVENGDDDWSFGLGRAQFLTGEL
jgi:phenylpyruvate tautomerase PptA (4-oxalocrotonate tautomerase family)